MAIMAVGQCRFHMVDRHAEYGVGFAASSDAVTGSKSFQNAHVMGISNIDAGRDCDGRWRSARMASEMTGVAYGPAGWQLRYYDVARKWDL